MARLTSELMQCNNQLMDPYINPRYDGSTLINCSVKWTFSVESCSLLHSLNIILHINLGIEFIYHYIMYMLSTATQSIYIRTTMKISFFQIFFQSFSVVISIYALLYISCLLSFYNICILCIMC